MRALFQSLPGLIDELSADEAREALVFAIWPTVLGEHLRERSAPVSFENGTLLVAVSSAEWKREFREHVAEIVYKLNRAFGKSIVERIEPTVNAKAVELAQRRSNEIVKSRSDLHSTPIELKAAASKIADPELRAHFLEAAALCIERRDEN